MSQDHGQDDRLDAAEVARMLGVSKATVYKMLEEGKLSGYLVGTRRRKIYRWSVDKWIAEHSFGAPNPAINGDGISRKDIRPKPVKAPKHPRTKKKK